MKASSHGLIRSSSVTFSIAPQPDIRDHLCDDMTIAQELLIGPKPPRRSNSLTGLSLRGFDSSNDNASSISPIEQTEDRPPRRVILTSNTWTTSSGDVLSDQDEVDDRTTFIQEYNRLAKKHGVRLMVAEDYEPFDGDSTNTSAKAESWYRKFLRRTSSGQSVSKSKPERSLRHRRSISDLSQRLKSRKDRLKDKDLQELVRLCGSSLLYLPAEYAAASLAVPTCFRATAQYLVQHGIDSRGVFRIPGSHSIVASLYNHYCSIDEDGEVVAGTVRCPTLPNHIRCDVHDVASAFKRFLSGLPGGILGSLPLFDAFVSIQSQLHGEPELTRTKQTKLRARLIALAIGSLRSQYRRELICAVFGLLCMIGRTAETARREDERGRPLPTSDLMGYGPLGIVFGPLLVGDLLEDYTMRLANPHGGLILLPVSPPKSRKERKKHEKEKEKSKSTDGAALFNTHVDKIKVANSITEMLITHWRDVVRHMKNLHALKVMGSTKQLAARGTKQPFLRPSASDTFAIRKPPNWDEMKPPIRMVDASVSPTPIRRFTSPVNEKTGDNLASEQSEALTVRKQRSNLGPMSSQRLSLAKSLSILSPTVEERTTEEDQFEVNVKAPWRKEKSDASSFSEKENRAPPHPPVQKSSHPGSKGKSNVFGINPSKYMESTLSLAKGVPKETPSKLVNQNKVASSSAEKESSPKPPKAQAKIQQSFRKGKLPKFSLKYHQHDSSPLWNESQDKSLTPESKNGLKIKILRASSPSIEGLSPGHVRRMAGSEPGLQPKTQIRPRRVSRSLYDDPKRKKLATLYPFNKDPLSRVSREEDEASLAQLAEALSANVIEDLVQDLECKTAALVEDVVGELAARRSLDAEVKQLKAANQDEKHHNLEARTVGDPPASVHPHEFGQIQKQALKNKRFPGLSENTEPKPSPNDTSSQIPITPETSMESSPIRRKLNRPASAPSNKLSSLIAKFNTPESKALLPLVRPRSASPIKLPTEGIAGSPRDRIESPKDSLIAPYTSNPPSPTRSQKPGKSEKTPKSARNPLSVDCRPTFDGTAPKNPTPCRISRNSPKNSTPKGANPKTLDQNVMSSTISPRSTSDLITLSPPQTLSHRGGAESPKKLLQERSSVVQSTPCEVYGSSINKRSSIINLEAGEIRRPLAETLGHRPLRPLNRTSSNPDLVSLHSFGNSVDEYLVPSTDSPSSAPSASLETSPPNVYQRLLKPISNFSLSEVPRPLFASSEPSSTFVTGEILPRPDPPPVAHHLNFYRPITTVAEVDIENSIHSTSSFKEAYTRTRSTSPVASPPLGRSNSVLYTQIRDFQKQLASKDEEVRHLRQQLGARANLDIGTLSERLREAKREIQMWQTRAEVAEKQVEISAKVHRRSNSHVTSKDKQTHRSSTEYSVDEKRMAERIRRALHGMDGAGSSQAFDSEESDDTVIKEAVTKSEYSAWIQQTTNLLDDTELHELE